MLNLCAQLIAIALWAYFVVHECALHGKWDGAVTEFVPALIALAGAVLIYMFWPEVV